METQTEPSAKRPRAKPNKAKLTRPFITRWKRNPPVEATTWWHTGLAGFGVMVYPTGDISYLVRYSIGRGRGVRKQRQLTLPGTLPPDKAEQQAKVIQNDALKGIDPLQQRRDVAAKATKPATYEEAVERFIEEYAKPRQRTWDQTRRVLLGSKKDPHPWMKASIKDITKQQIKARLRQFINNGHSDQARNLKSWLATFFKWAADEDIIDHAISVNLDIEKRSRDRIYSDDEIRAVWKAADQLGREEGTYIKLIMLLAPRKIALADMADADLDSLDTPTMWTTPHELTKTRKTAKEERVYLTPLPPLAQRLFRRVAKEGRLFPSLPVHTTAAGRRVFNSDDLKQRLIEFGAPGNFKFHSWRHTIASWLKGRGYSLFERGLVLNHAESGVTADYSHGYPVQLKLRLLTEWADHVEALVQPAEGVPVLA